MARRYYSQTDVFAAQSGFLKVARSTKYPNHIAVAVHSANVSGTSDWIILNRQQMIDLRNQLDRVLGSPPTFTASPFPSVEGSDL